MYQKQLFLRRNYFQALISAGLLFSRGLTMAASAQPALAHFNPYVSLPALKSILNGSLYYRGLHLPHYGLGAAFNPWHAPGNLLYQDANYLVNRVDATGVVNNAVYSRALLAKSRLSGGPLSLNFGAVGGGVASGIHGPINIPKGGFATMGAPAGGGVNPWGSVTFSSDGPNNFMPPGQSGFGPSQISGRVNGVAYDPNNPDTYYVASAGGGVWKTTNAGVSWKCLSNSWPAQATACVTVDPHNSNVIYVGTGDIVYGTTPFGIMKSTDGGDTWTNEGNANFGGSVYTVYKIRVDPDNDQIVTAIAGGAIYRSTDGGTTWRDVYDVGGTLLDLQYGLRPVGAGVASAPHILLATGSTVGVLLSEDNGATWHVLDNASTLTARGGGCSIAPSATQFNTYYVLDGGNSAVVKETFDGSFNVTSANITGTLESANWSQQWYDYDIRCAGAGGTDQLYVGLLDIYEYDGQTNTNGQPVWTSLLGTYSGHDLAHTDQHALAIDPNDPTNTHFLIGNDGGVYQLLVTPGKGGVNSLVQASSLNASLDITQFYHVDAYAGQAGWILGGTQDNGTTTSNVGGLGHTDAANWLGVGGGDGGGCAIDSQDPSIDYGTAEYSNVYYDTGYWTGNALDISPNAGYENKPFVPLMVQDPNNGNIMYTGTNYLYRWNYATKSWTNHVGGIKFTITGIIDAIAVAPSNSNIVYVGTSTGKIWMTTDGGINWKVMEYYPIPSVVEGLSVLSYNPYDVVAVGDRVVAHCTNTQVASPVWTRIDDHGANSLPQIDYHTVARNPYDPSEVFFVGTDIGGYYTVDGGNNWYNLNAGTGLPSAQISDIKAVLGTGAEAGHGLLTISTYGRGVYQTVLHNLLGTLAISPNEAPVGGSSFVITVTGEYFTPGDVVTWNGKVLTSTYGTSSSLTAVVPAYDLNKAGSAEIAVSNPNLGTVSNSQMLLIGVARIMIKATGVVRNSNSTVTVTVSVTNTGTVPITGLSLMSSTLGGKAESSYSLASTVATGATATGTVTFPSTVAKGRSVLIVHLRCAQGTTGTAAVLNVP